MSDGDKNDHIEDSKAPLISHLVELRDRLKWVVIAFFAAFCVSYFFAEQIYSFLVRPLATIYADMGVENPRMIYTALTEAFFTYLKVSFYTALFISFPIFASQIYKFAAPGLYQNEKKAFYPFLIATPILFALGAGLVYYFIFPLAWKFFLSFQTVGSSGGLPIQLEAKVNEYLSLVLKLMFAFGLAFQLPVAITLLSTAGLVSATSLRKKRKYAIVVAFAAAAILTPPDLISQIGLGIPIILLFEISIFLASLIEKKKGYNSDGLEDEENSNFTDNDENNFNDEDVPETDYNEEK